MLSVALAISAALPGGVALAQEADQEREGAAAPEPAPPDATADPRFDPGGDSHLPFNIGAPTGGGDDDSGDGPPVDVEPVTDPDALGLLLDDPGAVAPDAVEGADEPVAPVEQPVPAAPSPAPAPPAAAAPEVEAPNPPTAKRRSNDRGKTSTKRKRAQDRGQQRPVIRVTIPAAVPAPAPVVVPAAPAVEPVATTTAPDKPARPGQRSYRVRSGDSLWKIASDVLGAGATNAEIVAESNRIYQLNRDRIGPDPDVLAVGTVLRLR
jgi:hypothetical protein